MNPDLVLDCRGMRCPLPVIELARRIGDVPAGGVIAVVSDDPAAATDVPAWCRLRGQEYHGTVPHVQEGEPAGSAATYLVRRVS